VTVAEYLWLSEAHNPHEIWAMARAAGDLSTRELVTLAGRLKAIDPGKHRHPKSGRWVPVFKQFKLRPKDRRALAERLFAEGTADVSARRELSMSRDTWRRVQNDRNGSRPTPPAWGIQAVSEPQNGNLHGRQGSGLRRPLSAHASGTDWAEHRQILELIGAA
jgi:hypothetical protein